MDTTKMTAQQIAWEMIFAPGRGPARDRKALRILLDAVGVEEEIDRHQKVRATDAGWRGGPTEVSATSDAVTPEQESLLHAVARELLDVHVSRYEGTVRISIGG